MSTTTATSPPTWDDLGNESQPQNIPASMLTSVERFVRRFSVLPDAAYLTAAIWTIATHTAKSFDCFPYLALFSPAKRCGKTRLLEVLDQLVSNPWRGTAPSPAALYRMLSQGPTLLLDEVEMFSRKDKSEATQTLLAVLNAGHRKGATIPRCDGPKHTLKYFPVYGPKAFAVIGRLPDTLTDRSIVVTLQRRAPEQKIERFLTSRAAADAKPIRDSVATFVKQNQASITQAYTRLMANDLAFLEDRDADLWMPLFSVCSVAAPERMTDLKRSAVLLSAAKAGDDANESLPLKLLTDIRAVWPEGRDRCDTATLIELLKQLEESPWGEYELTPRKLARLLRPFEVAARVMRVSDALRVRGYDRTELFPVIERYVGLESVTCVTSQ